ncbi:6-phosphogluconolactonase [Gemmatimonadota bacterium]
MDNRLRPRLEIFPDPESMSRAAALFISERLRQAVDIRGRASLALSGGSTPRRIYQFLVSLSAPVLPWEQIHLFWGDERWVPADDPESNYALARETILNTATLPPENIHPVPTNAATIEEGAARYEEEVRTFFASSGGSGDSPTFDLIHLGVGEDGHTASLFPDDPALLETDRWVVPVTSPSWRPPRERVTFTLPLINNARTVLFTASGNAKRKVVKSIVLDQGDGEMSYPAAMVNAIEDLVWYVDEESIG